MDAASLADLPALVAEPRVARPGQPVTLRLAVRNVGSAASTAGMVRFVLEAGLVAAGPLELPLPAAEPGGLACVETTACAGAVLDDGTPLRAWAEVELDGRRLRTAAATVTLRSRPRLDGPRSVVDVTRTDAQTIAIGARIHNDGDGPAIGLVVLIPPPDGCVPLDGEAATRLACERLDPGTTAELAYEARLVDPAPVVTTAARVQAHGLEVVVAAAPLVLGPELAAPEVAVARAGRRLDVRLWLRNDGWGEAVDVDLAFAFPAGVRPVDAAPTVDGIPVVRRGAGPAAYAALVGEGPRLRLARIPARDRTEIALAATIAAGAAGGRLGVTVDGTLHEIPLVVGEAREVRARIARLVACARGHAASVELVNAGDRVARPRIAVEEGELAAVEALPATLAPGTLARALVILRGAGSATIAVSDGETPCARLGVVLPAVPAPTGPGAGVEEPPAELAVAAGLETPAALLPGLPAEIALALRLDAEAGELVVACAHDGAAPVSGSMRLDGHAVRIDAAAMTAGLRLRAVPAGVIALRWSVVAVPGAETATVDVAVHADGAPVASQRATIAIERAAAFARRAPTLPYYVEAIVDGPAAPDGAPAPAAPAPAATPPHGPPPAAVVIDATRRREIDRLLRLPAPGLAGHVVGLLALFPSGSADASLTALREALADEFDRLWVLLRIPGITLVADDLDGGRLRAAYDAFAATRGLGRARGSGASLVRALVAAIAPARTGDDAADAALARYLARLDAVLSGWEIAPPGAFDDALAAPAGAMLDDDREALVAALDAVAERIP